MTLIRFWTLLSLLCWLTHLTFCAEDRDLLVITVATNETDGYHRFMRSQNVYNLNVKVLGLGLTWEGGDVKNLPGGGQKVKLLKEELLKYKDDPNRIIMFTDSYDVIFTAGKNVILEKFDNLNARVVFGAEDFCWPDKNLAAEYPRVSFGYKYLNSGGFIGYAPEVYNIVSLYDINSGDDDQLYYTKIFLDENAREKYKIKLDTQANIFQNLNGQLSDVSLKFEDDDVKIINTVYQSTPVAIHGNGPSKIQLNSLGNYLAKSWTHDDGCLSCRENIRRLKNLSKDEYPRVLIAVFIVKPAPFLEDMLAKIVNLNYPKNKLDILVYNQAKLHESLIKTWVNDQDSAGYHSTKLISTDENMKDWHARNLAIDLCLKNSCDALFSVDGDVHLDNPETLTLLLEHNRPMLGASLVREGQAWSTFWGAINEDGFYARSIDYMDIVNNNRRNDPPSEAISRGLREILGNVKDESSNQPIDEPQESNAEKTYAVLEPARFQPDESSQTVLQESNQKSYDVLQPSMSFTVHSAFINEPINIVIGGPSTTDVVQRSTDEPLESTYRTTQSEDIVEKSGGKIRKRKADRRILPYTLFKPENSLSCPSCGVQVASKGHLQRHQSAHGANRQFQCANCDCSFTRKEKLKKHLKCAHVYGLLTQ